MLTKEQDSKITKKEEKKQKQEKREQIKAEKKEIKKAQKIERKEERAERKTERKEARVAKKAERDALWKSEVIGDENGYARKALDIIAENPEESIAFLVGKGLSAHGKLPTNKGKKPCWDTIAAYKGWHIQSMKGLGAIIYPHWRLLDPERNGRLYGKPDLFVHALKEFSEGDLSRKRNDHNREMIFQSGKSLQQVVNVVNEAAAALNDKDRTIMKSSIPEALGGALGAGIGGAASFAALYGLGTVGLSAVGITSGLAAAGTVVGGGMAAGIFVLAAPVAALAVGGATMAALWKNKQLREEKERLYTEALRKHEAIIKALKDEADAGKERQEYLQSLNILLTQAIKDLKEDLGKA